MITFPASLSREASHPDVYRDAVIATSAPAPAHSPTDGRRRSQLDRSRTARERLLAAAIDVLIRSGYNGLTTKEVARCAGMSNGALMHHFGSKEELVVAATAWVYQAASDRGRQVANTAAAAQQPIEGFITDCLSVYFDWPFIAALEVIVVARTDPALMARILPVMEEYRDTVNASWLSVFEESGMAIDQARVVLDLTLNVVRGMALNGMWRKNEQLYKQQLQEWVSILAASIVPGYKPGKHR